MVPKPKPETPDAAAARRAQRLTRRPRIDRAGEHPSWAELLKRFFSVDGFACPGCSGPLALRCIVLNPMTARRIIAGLQHATGPPGSSPEGDNRTA